jgi:threonine aldolase
LSPALALAMLHIPLPDHAMIELFSDTKTKPTAAMRTAMANAEVGDERAGEDPTVNRLVERCAALLGKEAALYLPSGTMCNEIALAAHCRPGDEVLCDVTSHIIGFEGGGPAVLAGVMLNPISGTRGIYTAAQLQEKLRADRPYAARQRLVEVEQTANLGGGAIWPLATLRAIAEVAHGAGLATHMDGARLLNACVASGIAAAEYTRGFDSVWIDFSKGLGAPGGAVLAGSRDFIAEAQRWQFRIGGAMRQSGIIAAACEYALDHHVARLAEDHANARRLADGIAAIRGLRIDPTTVETNLVYFDVVPLEWTAEKLCDALRVRDVRMGAMSARTVRAVTHLDVDLAGIDKALAALREVLA